MSSDIEGDEFSGIILESLPVTGTLYLSGEEVEVTGSVLSDVSELSYQPMANDVGRSSHIGCMMGS